MVVNVQLRAKENFRHQEPGAHWRKTLGLGELDPSQV